MGECSGDVECALERGSWAETDAAEEEWWWWGAGGGGAWLWLWLEEVEAEKLCPPTMAPGTAPGAPWAPPTATLRMVGDDVCCLPSRGRSGRLV